MKTTEPNQAVERTICIVKDHAQSSKLRANADHRSLERWAEIIR
ncbi:hypothetical protein BH11VER1_BH11VER1_20490 [soil metagenome]